MSYETPDPYERPEPGPILGARQRLGLNIAGWSLVAASVGVGGYAVVSAEMNMHTAQETIDSANTAIDNITEAASRQGVSPDAKVIAAHQQNAHAAITSIPRYELMSGLGKGILGLGAAIAGSVVTINSFARRRASNLSNEQALGIEIDDLPKGMAFTDFLSYLSNEAALPEDDELTSRVPDIFSAVGQQLKNIVPEFEGSRTYAASDAVAWSDLRAGDMMCGEFRLCGIAALDDAIAGKKTVTLHAYPTNCKIDHQAPSMQIHMPREEFTDNLTAIRALTGRALMMDVLVKSNVPELQDGKPVSRLVATPLQVVGMEQPFRPEQLQYAQEGSFHLLAGVVGGIDTYYGNTWLRVQADDGSSQLVRSTAYIHYTKTIDGLPPPIPREGDRVHILATIDSPAAGDRATRFKNVSAYRIEPAPGGEVAEAEYHQHVHDLLFDISSMNAPKSYDTFRATVGELALMRPSRKVAGVLIKKYNDVFSSLRDDPVALHEQMWSRSLAILDAAFESEDIASMTVSQFKAFTVAVARGKHVPSFEVPGAFLVPGELFATNDSNPELVSECLQKILPAIVDTELEPQPFQLNVLEVALYQVVIAFPPEQALEILTSVTELYIKAKQSDNTQATAVFNQLLPALTTVLERGKESADTVSSTYPGYSLVGVNYLSLLETLQKHNGRGTTDREPHA